MNPIPDLFKTNLPTPARLQRVSVSWYGLWKQVVLSVLVVLPPCIRDPGERGDSHQETSADDLTHPDSWVSLNSI